MARTPKRDAQVLVAAVRDLSRARPLEDIYQGPRIPADAYRPTFVKSLAMGRLRQSGPIGAIGTYWAKRHVRSPSE